MNSLPPLHPTKQASPLPPLRGRWRAAPEGVARNHLNHPENVRFAILALLAIRHANSTMSGALRPAKSTMKRPIGTYRPKR
jgi:hypothetical protein